MMNQPKTEDMMGAIKIKDNLSVQQRQLSYKPGWIQKISIKPQNIAEDAKITASDWRLKMFRNVKRNILTLNKPLAPVQ